jgi:hypothetical protein
MLANMGFSIHCSNLAECLKHGGIGIFVHECLAFTNIDLQEFCMEQDRHARPK